jgi:hypothetical protein
MMIMLLTSGLVASCGSGPPPPSTPPAGVQTFTGLARDHVQGHVNYTQNPTGRRSVQLTASPP